MLKLGRFLGAMTLAATMAACSSVASPSNQAAEDYTDTLQPLGQVFKNFSVDKTGEMQIVLQSLTPRPVVGFVSLAVGAPAGATCQPYAAYVVQQAAVGQQYAFPQIVKGSYCITVADGNAALTAPAVFTLHFTHP